MSNYGERVLARRLLERMGLQMTTNVPLMKMCRSLGYKVFLVGPESLDPGDLDGNSMSVNGVAVIQINRGFPACRRRFSLAHEMGHILCGHHFRSGKTEKMMEREADVVAAELLMPIWEFKHQASLCNFHAGVLASIFRVSPAAAKIRLSVLGLTPRRHRPGPSPALEATF